MSAIKIFFSIAAGFATGAILGTLFAPASGSTSRRRISQSANDAEDTAKERLKDSVDAIAGRYASMQDDAIAWAEKGNGNSPL